MNNVLTRLLCKSFVVILLSVFGYTSSWCQADVFVHIYVCPQDMATTYIDETNKAHESDGVCNSGTYLHESPQITGGPHLVNSVRVTRLDGGPHRAQVDISWKDNSEGDLTVRITYKKRIWNGKRVSCKWSERYAYTLVVHRKLQNPEGNFVGTDAQSAINPSTEVTFHLTYTPSPNFPKGLVAKKIRYTNVSGSSATVEQDIPRLFGTYLPTPIIYKATGFGSHQIHAEVLIGIGSGCETWMELPEPKQVTIISLCHRNEFSNVILSIVGVPEVDQFLTGDHPPAFAVKDNQTYSLQVENLTEFDLHYTWNFEDFGSDVTGGAAGFTPLKKGSYRITVDPNIDLCPVPSGLIVMVGIGEGDRLVIDEVCTIVLPRDISEIYRNGETGDIIFEHFRSVVSTERSIIVNPGITLELGAELLLDNPEPGPGAAGETLDLDENFVEKATFDEYGRVLTSGRKYFDDKGIEHQAQIKNLSAGVILGSATIYDTFDRAAITTLPAPVKAAPSTDEECPNDPQVAVDINFELNPNLVSAAENDPYNHLDFDTPTTAINPLPVDDSVEGTLGWYYSANNVLSTNTRTREPLVAQTQYPYIRTVFHSDGTGDIKGSTKPGDEYRAGTGYMAETVSTSIAANDEYLTDPEDGYLTIRENELGFDTPASIEKEFFKTISEDEMNRKTLTYTDKSGNIIISVFMGTEPTPITKTYQYFDKAGRMTIAISANGINQYNNGQDFDDIDKTTYEYNSKGLVSAKQDMLNGKASGGVSRMEYLYRADGQIRFSQNSLQRNASTPRFSYRNYDAFGRIVETGEFTGSITFNSLKPYADITVPGSSLPGNDGNLSERLEFVYDEVQDNVPGPGNRTQRFVGGAVSFTKRGNDITTWYSYDERGRIEWIVQNIVGLGVKTIDYRYGANGGVQDVIYQNGVDEEQFIHHYEYNLDGKLKKVYTTRSTLDYDRYGKLINPGITYLSDEQTIDDTGPLELQATYHYYLHGPLKRVELGDDRQGIDYVYTADGILKSINSASIVKEDDPGKDGHGSSTFKPDVFGMSLDYHTGDYLGTGGRTDGAQLAGAQQYTGLIHASRWHGPVEPAKQVGYLLTYDQQTQLSRADWGEVTNPLDFPDQGPIFTADPNDIFKEHVGSYDDNGNIVSLNRNRGRSLLSADNNNLGIADFGYEYIGNSNLLEAITNGDGPARSFEYDEVGRAIKETVGPQSRYISYNSGGKVVGVYLEQERTHPVMTATYDDRGFRLSKKIYNETGTAEVATTWYVREGDGRLIATYEKIATDPVKLSELPVYGEKRLGVYSNTFGMTLHEIADHLGNVRAVIGDPITKTYLATMEDERLEAEDEEGFLNLSPAETAGYINHTEESTVIDGLTVTVSNPNEVNRMNNRPTGQPDPNAKPVGTGIVLWVHPGDEIDMEVFAKYASFDDQNPDVLLGLSSFLAQTFSTAPVIDGTTIFNVVNTPGFAMLPAWAGLDETQPRAFLNYLLFDNNNKLVDFNFHQVGSEAEIGASPMSQPHQRLAIDDLKIEKEGFIYIYVSNLTDQNMDVYFDDLKVTHTYSNVVAGGDYYPFGLAIKERQVNREYYRHGFQGQNSEKDDETGWNHFEVREYDPTIARWLSPDPESQFNSPYVSMGNDPINGADGNGAWVLFLYGELSARIGFGPIVGAGTFSQSGSAYDSYGRVKYTMSGSFAYENLTDLPKREDGDNWTLGGEAGVEVGGQLDWSKDSFRDALGGFSKTVVSAGPVDLKVGTNTISLDAGLSLGAGLSNIAIDKIRYIAYTVDEILTATKGRRYDFKAWKPYSKGDGRTYLAIRPLFHREYIETGIEIFRVQLDAGSEGWESRAYRDNETADKKD